MLRKAVFDDYGRTSESAIDEEDEEWEDEEKRHVIDGRRAKARQLLSEYGW